MRVGIATGPVTAALGDVFGPTVNLAHRITQSAAPGAVFVDEHTANALAASGELALEESGARLLQGLGHVPLWSVSVSPDAR